jgi:D-serine deaminase-like pyridoxal phosphate-dependent protein
MMKISQLDTPVAVVDLDKLEANIKRLQAYLDEHGIANRPHMKTHKIPEIAHMQIKAGAVGINCQKLGEAEVMAQAGIEDILITYNLMGQAKLERLQRLAHRLPRLSVVADSPFIVQGLSRAMEEAGATLTVLVEFDSGSNRCGTQTPEETAELARLIARSPGLRFGGLMTYPSTAKTDAAVPAVKSLLAADGISLERVSGGGSPNMWEAHTHPAVTEHRAGTYVYGDRDLAASGAVTLEQCAFSVITTIVSRPTAERGILDGGSKTFSSDHSGKGFGLVVEYPEANIYKLNEEHGYVDLSACARKPEIGERLTVIPNHCCVVSNLFNQIVGVRGGEVEVIWPVACRGLLQ